MKELGMTPRNEVVCSGQQQRRWFRFSLRTLLILLSIFGIWLGVRVNRARQQEHAVELIQRAGGEVIYDFGLSGQIDPPGPKWLHNLIGDHYFVNVKRVSFGFSRQMRRGDSNVSDESIMVVTELPYIEELRILDTGVTTKGLAHVGRLKGKGLTRFTFGDIHNEVLGDGNGVNHLGDLTSLESLVLINVPLGSDGLSFLSRLRNIQHLNLVGAALENEDLRYVSPLNGLTQLILSRTPIGDDGLRHLAGLTNLRDLRLGGTRIQGHGLVHLKGLRSLEVLSLFDTNVGDDAVTHLMELKSLKELRLGRTSVTGKELDALQQALPNCKIETP
jgi:hypothetical protein